MINTTKYMKSEYNRLTNCYLHEDGLSKRMCFSIARNVQKTLADDNKESSIFWVRSTLIDSEGKRGCLTPQRYGGKVGDWRVHVVAVADKQVFDPMVGNPVSLEDYCKTAFHGDCEILPYSF